MTFNLRTLCALALAIGVGVNGYAQSETAALASPLEGALLQEVAPIQDNFVEPVSCNTCDSYDSCDSGGCDLGLGAMGSQNGQFFVGAEYLSIRANFSEATAFVKTDLVANTTTWEQFDFDYSESFRTYAGYRLCDCGGEIRFTYTSIDTDGGFDSGALDTAGGTVAITPPLELVTINDGDRVFGTANVSIDNYDLGFSKTIPLGSPLCCDTGCGDTCCGDCCGTGCCPRCPAWDIQWTGALRIADVSSRLAYQTDLVGTAPPNRSAESVVNFEGVGMRTGLQGRRYIGDSGIASVYLRGDFSLLLGEVEHYAEGTTTSINQITSTQVVPVTEMEAGATVYLLPNVSVTGGYMLAVWHDLGHRATYDFSSTGGEIESMDDANLMTLDGWFLRAEAAF